MHTFRIRPKDARFITNLFTGDMDGFVDVSKMMGVTVDRNLLNDTSDTVPKFFAGEITVDEIDPRTRRFVADVTKVNIDWISRFTLDIKRAYPTFFAMYMAVYQIGSRMRALSTFVDIMEGNES